MYKVDLSYLKRRYRSAYISFLVAVILFVLYFLICLLPNIKKNEYEGKVEASNTIISSSINEDNKEEFSAVYEYIVDDITYKCEAHTVTNTKDGYLEKNMIYYDINSPEKCVTQYDTDLGILNYIILSMSVIAIIVGFCILYAKHKEKKRIMKLETNGILVKGLRYKLVESNTPIPGTSERITKYYKCIEVRYEVTPGRVITLKSFPIYTSKVSDDDCLVDLLIDPNDETNYFLDFEIKTR